MFVFFSNFLPESSLKYELLGLNLLWLLTQNRVAEFHTELELLSPKDIQNNVFIHYPVSLEQYLMEGCYNKVINSCLKFVLIKKGRLIFVCARSSLLGIRFLLQVSATSWTFWLTLFAMKLLLAWRNHLTRSTSVKLLKCWVSPTLISWRIMAKR